MPPRRRAALPGLAQSLSQDAPAARSRRAKAEPSPYPEPEQQEGDGEDAEGEVDDEAADAGPSRSSERSRAAVGGAPGGQAGRGNSRSVARAPEDEDVGTDNDVEDDGRHSRRARKSVSYREIPVVDPEEEEAMEEGEEADEAAPSHQRSQPSTPRRRGRPHSSPLDDEEDDDAPSRPVIEKVGSGRGGFSVKGAAAAAARARWAKVRAEKIARGEDPDEPVKRKQTGGGGGGLKGRASKVTDETYAIGATLRIKGVDYTVGDDELILPDDPKGEAKVDADGKLLGGREYKLTTFTSEGRRNTSRVYAMTIDAARACGYNDSLAFLRRCPTIIKMACTPEERQLLIDIGRITGNLKYRQITMVSMRNVYKVMGARVVKGGKWVTDDYYEDDMLAKCPELGYTPHVEATEDEIMGEVMQHTGGAGRVPTGVARDLGPQASAFSLTPFYTLGGPTTHFAGSGSDPWTEAKWGHKRQKLRSLGVTEQDWLYRTAEETRRIDQQLRDYREERIVELEGSDATRGWVYASEQRTDGRAGLSKAAAARQDSVDSRLDEEPEESSGGLLKPPAPERRRSHLSQEVRLVGDLDAKASATVERAESAALTPLPGGVTPDDALGAAGGAASGGMIVVQTEEEERVMRAAHQWGLGMEWRAGVVKAAYEPHTHMPHVPLRTQPIASTFARVAPYPAIGTAGSGAVRQGTSREAVRGLASMEYVLQPHADSSAGESEMWYSPVVGGAADRERRLREVEAAVEWEQEMRRKRNQPQEVV